MLSTTTIKKGSEQRARKCLRAVVPSVQVGRITAGDIYPTVKCRKDNGSKGDSAQGQQILKVDLEDVSINVVVNSRA